VAQYQFPKHPCDVFLDLLRKERNDRTFDRRVKTIDDVLASAFDEVGCWFQKHLEPAAAAALGLVHSF
jgi:hypothetical protein